MLAIVGFGQHVKKNILPALERINISVHSIVVRELSNYSHDDIVHYKLSDSLSNVLNNENISHIYIATPNSSHVKISRLALLSKKNVLCEKTVSNNLVDLVDLFEIADRNDCLFIEMSMFLMHAQFYKLESLIKSSVYGQVKSIKLVFKIPHLEKSNVRYSKALLGGALLDLGFYPLTALIKLLPSVEMIDSKIKIESDYEVDTYGLAHFSDGNTLATCEWGFGFDYSNFIELHFENSTVRMERAFTKPADMCTALDITLTDGTYSKINIPPDDCFGNVFNSFLKGNLRVERNILVERTKIVNFLLK
jgi:NDP-hexose-3-ketoreductase